MDVGTILLLTGGLALLKGASTAKDLAQISYDIVGLQVHKIRLLKNEVEIKIRYLVSNPSPTAVTVESIAANVYYKNNFIGFANMNTPVEVKAQSQTELRVTAKWTISKIISLAAEFLKNKSLKGLRVSGTLTALGKNLPLEKTIDLK